MITVVVTIAGAVLMLKGFHALWKADEQARYHDQEWMREIARQR